MHILIIGAGIAGLSAAVTLAQRHKITLIEAAPHAGGRARGGIKFGNQIIDNGQHVFLGSYLNMLKFLELINIDESKVFMRKNFRLEYLEPAISFNPTNLLNILFNKYFTLKDKLSLLKFIKFLKFEQSPPNITIDALLKTTKQTSNLINLLWHPLSYAALADSPRSASAELFCNILKATFMSKKNYSDWLLPKTDLSSLFINPALKFLTQHNVNLHFNTRLTNLIINNNTCSGIITSKGEFYADRIILALPTYTRYLSSSGYNKLNTAPITTVYLQLKHPISLPFPLCHINNCNAWLFDRSLSGNKNIISIVLSGAVYDALPNHELINILLKQISHIINHNDYIAAKIIREKHAIIAGSQLNQNLRPEISTNINNLFIIGDFIRSIYPATVESAIESGFKVASILN